MVILDTNVIIDHLRQSERQKDSVLMNIVRQHSKDTLALSLISVQELYEGESTKDPLKEQLLLATVSPLRIVPYTYKIAQRAGIIARDLREPIELADAAIAATALEEHMQLATLNTKHFRKIPGLKLFDGF